MNASTKMVLIIGGVALVLLIGAPFIRGTAAGWPGQGMMGPGMTHEMMGPAMMGRISSDAAGRLQSIPPVNTATIAMRDFAFSPAHVQVPVSATVTWTNEDSVAHTVTGTSGIALDSPLLGIGEVFSHTFTEPGTYSYYCVPHPWMTGVVTVG